MVEMDNERFEYLVFLCTPKKDDRQWNIGDAALEIFPMGEKGEKTGITEKLKEFAKKIDVEYNTVLKCRQVASSFPVNLRRLAQSFAVHHALQAFPQLMRDDLTVRQAMALVKEEKERLAEESKARAEEEAKRRAEELLRLAEEQRLREEAERREEERRASQAHDEAVLYSLLTSSISKLTEADRAYTKLRDHNSALTTRVNGYIQQIEDLLLVFKTSVNSDVDEAISNLLREES